MEKTEEMKGYEDTFSLVSEFSKIYKEEIKKLPYHINIIDELHANENAHSRIFAKLLQYKKDNTFIFLKDFLKKVCEFNISTKNLEVQKVDSCGRIDIPILSDNHFIIIENKINGAEEQNEGGGQLARYIENVRDSYNLDLKDIYVIYMIKYRGKPSDEMWKNASGHSYKNEFEGRYKSISYRDDIYQWLKKIIKPIEKDKKNRYLYTTLLQYIDYLKGEFSLRTINKNMNMELQEFIKEELKIENEDSKKALKILSEKETDLNNVISQLNLLKIKYQKEIIENYFTEWKDKLEKDFSNVANITIIEDKFIKNEGIVNIGVQTEVEGKDYAIILECNNVANENTYVGIRTPFSSNEKHKISDTITKILENNKLAKPEALWYGWKYTKTTENSYTKLKELIEAVLFVK